MKIKNKANSKRVPEKEKNFIYYLSRHKIAVTMYVLCIVFGCASSGAMTIMGANFLGTITTLNFEKALTYLIYLSIFTVIWRITWYLSYLIYTKYSNLIWVEIADDLTKRSFELSSSTFSENNTGSFVQRIMSDPLDVLGKMATLVELITECITNAVVVIYIITLNPLIGCLYILILTAMFMLELKRKQVAQKNKKASKEINDQTYSVVNEIIKSEKDIKVLGMESKLQEVSNENMNRLQKANCKYDIVDTHFWNARCFILDMFGIITLFLGIFMLKNESLTIAAFILLFTYKNNLYELCWCVGTIAKNLTEAKISSSRMFGLYNESVYKSDKFGTIELNNVKGKIEFKNVEYAYSDVEEVENENKKGKKRETKHIKKEPIFKNLSFEIKPNSTIAFVGKSGSGKSTIMSLIAKLNVVDKGEILIDGKNINTLSKQTLRNHISMISQFPYIFDMSIKENLLLVKKDATDEELWDVLERACFDEDVKQMPKGINTKVGETGVKLSGGQRQRLAIARALLKNSKIIMFDESTSSLDNFAQSHIQNSIENLKGQHTIIIVAHRLSTIKNADTIYFLENGEIKGKGSFDELFNNNEDFQKMFLIENI